MSNLRMTPGLPLDGDDCVRPCDAGERTNVLGSFLSDLSSKGYLGLLSTAGRMLRVGLGYASHRTLVRTIREGSASKLLETYPRVVYRYTLTYLSSNIERQRRFEMLKGHYQFINDRFDRVLFDQILDNAFTMWTGEVEGRQLSVSMSGPCLVTIHREGDLVLTIKMDDLPLYRVGFSFVPTNSLELGQATGMPATSYTIYVGQVQGVSGSFDQIRECTKLCHDIAPQDLLLSALAGIATAMGIDSIVGVDDEHNISFEKISKSAASFNYQSFWSRYNAHVTEGKHHVVPVPFHEKPIQLIQAKHRKRTLTKRAFKADIFDTVARIMQFRTKPSRG
jgi:uncharacterized protein VirK/YbjX